MVMEEQESDMELASERVPVPRVQKTTEDSHQETSNKVTSVSRGKPRFRKKALHAAILKQMEFYFSDANLRKDRFLGKLINEDPYVDLSLFLTFNKIRELTTDVNRIAKALEGSSMLVLSEDGSKVRRTTPIMQKENVDDCTVYVQNLPLDADHEMLSSIFSQYGSIAYVSVPRYKSNKKIKGFAFVEFDKPDGAKKCIKSFRKKGCILPSYTSPNDLLSITTFDDAEKDVTLQGREQKFDRNNACVTQVEIKSDKTSENCKDNALTTADEIREPDKEQESPKKPKKRKHKSVESSEEQSEESTYVHQQEDSDASKSKKKKHRHSTDHKDSHNDHKDEHIENEKISTVNGSPKNNKNKEKKDMSMEISVDEQASDAGDQSNQSAKLDDSALVSSANEDLETTMDDKKKKRKRKRRSKIDDVSYNMGLQVMAKRDWKHLRNKYLELQRSKMKQLKQHLRKTRWNYDKSKFEKEEHEEKEKVPKYENAGVRGFSFTPGVIVKIEMDKPCTDPKNFKMEMKGNSSVKYIDVEEGSYHAYIRCDTPEAAQQFAQKTSEERHMAVLKDDEEKKYWDKILQDRNDKLGNKIRIKQRGRNKLLKKAEKELGKHIKFDEV